MTFSLFKITANTSVNIQEQQSEKWTQRPLNGQFQFGSARRWANDWKSVNKNKPFIRLAIHWLHFYLIVVTIYPNVIEFLSSDGSLTVNKSKKTNYSLSRSKRILLTHKIRIDFNFQVSQQIYTTVIYSTKINFKKLNKKRVNKHSLKLFSSILLMIKLKTNQDRRTCKICNKKLPIQRKMLIVNFRIHINRLISINCRISIPRVVPISWHKVNVVPDFECITITVCRMNYFYYIRKQIF